MHNGLRYLLLIAGIMHGQMAFGMQALWTKQKAIEQAEKRSERKLVRELAEKERKNKLELAEGKLRGDFEKWKRENPKASLSFKIAESGMHPLIILFDPDGYEAKSSGTIALTLGKALKEAVAPIITSRVLYKYYWYQAKQWHSFTTSDQSLVILLPPSQYYQKLLDKKESIERKILLGMKLDNLTELTGNYKDKHSYDLRSYLKDILVTHDDLKDFGKEYEDAFVTWDIYLSGHGGLAERDYRGNIKKDAHGKEMEGQIAGLPLTNFKQFLQFLNVSINTRSLLYDTCYAGGEHLELPYQHALRTPIEEDIEKQLQENLKNQEHDLGIGDTNLKFMIISSTIFEKTTETSQESGFASSTQFQQYFSSLNDYFLNQHFNKPGSITLSQVLDYASEWSKSYDPKYGAWLQFPTVRFPNTGWFVLPEMDNTALIIDDAAVRRAQASSAKEIKVAKTVKMILVDTQNVPVKVSFEGDSMPLLLPSKIKKGISYSFQEIYAPNIYLIAGTNTSGTKNNPKIDFVTMLEMLKKKTTSLKEVASFYIKKLTINLDDNHELSDFDKNLKSKLFTRANICSDVKKCSDSTKNNALIFNDIEFTTGGRITISPIANASFDLFTQSEESFEKNIGRLSQGQTMYTERVRLEHIFDEYLRLQDKPQLLAQWKAKLSGKDQEWINGMSAPTQADFAKWEEKNWDYVEGQTVYPKQNQFWLEGLRDKIDKKRREALVIKYLKDKPQSLDTWREELSEDDKAWLSTLIDPSEEVFNAMKKGLVYEMTSWLDGLRDIINQKRREALVIKYLKDKPQSLDTWQEVLSADDKAWLSNLIDPREEVFNAMKKGLSDTKWLEGLRSSVIPKQ